MSELIKEEMSGGYFAVVDSKGELIAAWISEECADALIRAES